MSEHTSKNTPAEKSPSTSKPSSSTREEEASNSPPKPIFDLGNVNISLTDLDTSLGGLSLKEGEVDPGAIGGFKVEFKGANVDFKDAKGLNKRSAPGAAPTTPNGKKLKEGGNGKNENDEDEKVMPKPKKTDSTSTTEAK